MAKAEQRHEDEALVVYAGDGETRGPFGSGWVGWPIVHRIAQAIAEAEQRGAESRQQQESGWVPVEERLPDSDVWVLVASCEGYGHALAQLEFTDDSDGNAEPYWCCRGNINVPLRRYPFWMPLPPPPAERPAKEASDD